MMQNGRRLLTLLGIMIVLLIGLAWEPRSVLLMLVVMALTWLLGSLITEDLYGGNLRSSIAHRWRLIFYSRGAVQVVDDGKTQFPEVPVTHDIPLHAQRRLIIRPDNAAVTVRDNQQRLYGPGVYWLAPTEQVKYVFDLRVRHRSWHFEDVRSNDFMTATLKFGLSFKPRVVYHTAVRTIDLSNDSDPEMEYLKFLAQANWEHATRSTIERAVRQHIGTLSMGQLMTENNPGVMTQLEKDIATAAQGRLDRIGVKLDWLDLESVIPKGASPAPDTGWRERAKVEALREALTLLADASDKAMGLKIGAPLRHKLAVNGMLEELKKKPEYKALFDTRMNARLVDLIDLR